MVPRTVGSPVSHRLRKTARPCRAKETISKLLFGWLVRLFFVIRSCREAPSLFYTAEELVSHSATFYDRLALLSIDWESLASGLRWAFCEGNGRPTDPTLYLKCFLVGHIENIERETDLAARLADSISIRLFLFGTLSKSPPDHSSLSRVRRLMAGRCDFDSVLVKIIDVLASHGLVGGEAVAMDTSLVPSRARICVAPEAVPVVCTETPEPGSGTDSEVSPALIASLAEPAPVPEVPAEALVELEELRHPPAPKKTPQARKKLVPSSYDLDAKPAFKPGYPAQPSYKVGVAVDYKARVILAADTYWASMGEGQCMRVQFSDLVRSLGDVPGKAVADAGMDDAGFHATVEFFGAEPVTNLQKNSSIASGFGKERFHYDPERDVYVCPTGEALKCKSSRDKLRRSYVCSLAICNACPLKLWCHGSLKGPKQIDRTFDEDSRDRVAAARHDPERRKLLAMRRAIVEPVFSDFKEHRGLAMIWTKGLPCARMKAKLAATVWNLKILMKRQESQERAKAKAKPPTPPTQGKGKGTALALNAGCWIL
jgi:Transposase DDE domain/Transposase domain (DUF772)